MITNTVECAERAGRTAEERGDGSDLRRRIQKAIDESRNKQAD